MNNKPNTLEQISIDDRDRADNQSELLVETIEYYKTNERGISQDNAAECEYYCKSGKSYCAIGRILSKDYNQTDQDLAELNIAFGGSSWDTLGDDWSLLESDIYDDMNNKYGKTFLQQLQDLHDTEQNWNGNATGGYDLSQHGMLAAMSLIKTYGLSVML